MKTLNKPWKHYAKWNKSDTKFYLHEVPEIDKYIHVETEVTRDQERENCNVLF